MATHIRKDGIFAEEEIVGLCECASGLVLAVVSSELVEIDDFLNVGSGSELKLVLGGFGVANEYANLGGFRVSGGLCERNDFALHVALDGDLVQ